MRRSVMLAFGILRLMREYALCGGRLKLSGIKYYLGKNAQLWVQAGGSCHLGKKTWLSDNSYFSANGSIRLGYNNFFNANCRVIAMDRIDIGDNNLFGPNVVIVDHDHNFSDPDRLICEQGFTSKPIRIGSDIWVGANVTICAGVSICDRVVIGANSVVTRSITEPGVYAGLPAKPIKSTGNCI